MLFSGFSVQTSDFAAHCNDFVERIEVDVAQSTKSGCYVEGISMSMYTCYTKSS